MELQCTLEMIWKKSQQLHCTFYLPNKKYAKMDSHMLVLTIM